MENVARNKWPKRKKRNALYIPINSPSRGGGGLNGLFRRRENLANGVPLGPNNRERERGAKFKIRPGVTHAAAEGRTSDRASNKGGMGRQFLDRNKGSRTYRDRLNGAPQVA